MNQEEYLKSLIHELCQLPNECEWVEFKHNNAKAEDIGQYISALSNSALLSGKDKAYMLWGINDKTHDIIGTNFTLEKAKVGNEELENLTKQDRVRACYFHASLKYIERDYMTNSSLRERFGIEPQNGAMASRIINDALDSKLIRVYDDSVGAKARKYIPTWAGGKNV